MILNIILSSTAIAGIAMVWGRVLKNSPWLQEKLARVLPSLIYRALRCTFCFTFWTALFFSIIFDPLTGWLPPFRIAFAEPFTSFASITLGWMIMGTLALGIRACTEHIFRAGSMLTCILKNHPLHLDENKK